MRIDSHHHLWDLDIAQRGWLAGEVLAPINRTFSMDDFYAERASASIDKSILVQTLPDYDEMKEFFNVAANHESVVGVVAWIDMSKCVACKLRRNPPPALACPPWAHPFCQSQLANHNGPSLPAPLCICAHSPTAVGG